MRTAERQGRTPRTAGGAARPTKWLRGSQRLERSDIQPPRTASPWPSPLCQPFRQPVPRRAALSPPLPQGLRKALCTHGSSATRPSGPPPRTARGRGRDREGTAVCGSSSRRVPHLPPLGGGGGAGVSAGLSAVAGAEAGAGAEADALAARACRSRCIVRTKATIAHLSAGGIGQRYPDISPTPFVMTSKICPSGYFSTLSWWKVAVGTLPR